MFLGHPGGPFWAARDKQAWTIPKGLCEPGEAPDAAAKREFAEETGLSVDGPLEALGTFRLPGGKLLSVWAVEGNCDAHAVSSNMFEMEWPPRSGRMKSFPEIDRAAWFTIGQAQVKIVKGQKPVLDRLSEVIRRPAASAPRSPRSAKS